MRLPGFITPDGKVFLQGNLFDYTQDPRAERRRMIDLSANRAEGPADAKVMAVEYADMECGYCKFRGQQMDRLLEANPGISIRRNYKFFPLFLAHVWAMKAASAADCIFRYGGAAPMFRFKQAVYNVQESLTVGGIDQLAVSTAEAEGVTSADFLGCYLREESFARVPPKCSLTRVRGWRSNTEFARRKPPIRTSTSPSPNASPGPGRSCSRSRSPS